MSRLKLVAVLAAVTALGGCSSTHTWGAKLTPTGLPRLVDTVCGAPDVAAMWIRAANDNAEIWRIEFARPVPLREVTVGQKPEGAEEKVAWQPQAGDRLLQASVRRSDGSTPVVEFTLDQLKDGKVKYEDEYLTADEFAQKRASC
ncbi:hypothetical protein [Lentzea kentuckyensis]|uniref:hypothetical protein n=1 Tax=Lentzea kentuckyensis TaxID=360086 RepID=UPI000A3D22BA|nr:hypothetical protein [Lentzea kentuckyensis]